MNDKSSTSLCRICLSYGATIPLFEETSIIEDDLAHVRLSFCVGEKVEDIEGYPNNICTSCNTTLQLVFIFINKYKHTQKLLSNSLKKVKNENDNNNIEVCSGKEEEIILHNIKNENEDFILDSDVDDALPLIDIKIKERSSKKDPLNSKVQRGCQIQQQTNKTASKLEKNLVDSRKLSMEITKSPPKKIVHKEKKNKKESSIPQTKQKRNEAKKLKYHLCDHCGETFDQLHLLTIHKDRAHTPAPLKCSQCFSVFKSSIQLLQHVKRNHSVPKSHICATCGKAFSYKGLLGSHIKNVHNKHLRPKKSYACQYCEKTYKCPQSKIIHERSVHTGDRPAECSVCDKKFFHEVYLRQHMMLHTGETPFKCPICGRGYNQNGNMKSHLRNHKKSDIDPDLLSKLKPTILKKLKP